MEDEKIVQMYWERNEDAITETSSKYGPQCYALSRRILYQNEDVEECVNDTWLHTWNSIPPNRPVVLLPFLLKITRNLSIDRYKYNHSKKRYSAELSVIMEELGNCVENTNTPESECLASELSKEISRFLLSLSKKERNICIHRYVLFESAKEIGDFYHIRPGAVRVSLSKTRTKLRTYLIKEGLI